jgi:hypothetical protein
MANYAQLDTNNKVLQVIVIADSDCGGGGVSGEATGVAFCQSLVGAGTSWRLSAHPSADDGQIPGNVFRGRPAGIGMTYMSGVRSLGVASTDIFIPPKPAKGDVVYDSKEEPYTLFPDGAASWSVGVNTGEWYSPLGGSPSLSTIDDMAGKYYYWDETAYQGNNNVGWALSTRWNNKRD